MEIIGVPQTRQSGSTMVEVMLAAFMLLLIALAGGAYIYHARADISQQRNRRVAMEAAVGRLEAIRGTIYNQIRPTTNLDFSVYYLSRPNGVWMNGLSDPGEMISVNNRLVPLTTRVRYVDLEVLSGVASIPDSTDMLEIKVDAGYRVGSADRVYLETYYAPR